MFETKTLLTIVALLCAVLAYFNYIKDIFKGNTRPHAFTWLVWCTMSSVAFFSQVSGGGGVGTWVLAFTAIMNFVIFILSVYKGQTNITKLDWFCLMGAFLGVALFTINNSQILSLVIISAVEIIGFVPTIRKSLIKPYEETIVTFGFTSLKYIFAIMALENYSFTTVYYPVVVATTNALFVVLLIQLRLRIPPPTRKAAAKKRAK
jgi:hypothetical protein